MQRAANSEEFDVVVIAENFSIQTTDGQAPWVSGGGSWV